MASSTQNKVTFCDGNACSHCGRCCDWYYDGDFNRDLESYKRNKCHDLFDAKRRHCRSGASCRYLGIIIKHFDLGHFNNYGRFSGDCDCCGGQGFGVHFDDIHPFVLSGYDGHLLDGFICCCG